MCAWLGPSNVALRMVIVKGLLAGRQGFEPRYRGPESGEWISVCFGPLCFAPVLSATASVCFGPFRSAPVQSVSLCLTSSAAGCGDHLRAVMARV